MCIIRLPPIRNAHPKHKNPVDCGCEFLSGKRKDYKIDFDFAYPRIIRVRANIWVSEGSCFLA